MIYFSIFTGCLFIVALSLYIYRTIKTQQQLKFARQQVLAEKLKVQSERQEYVVSSINIIVQALSTAQIEVVEASIRLKVLVDQLEPSLTPASFPSMEEVFERTQHIPKLKDWKALEKKQRRQYSKDMRLLETKHSEAVKAEVAVLGRMMSERG